MIVSKFGGSSFSSAELATKTVALIKANPARRYIIASALGKTSNEIGVTDLLYMCHSAYENSEDYQSILDKILERYSRIIRAFGISFNIAAEILALKKDLITGKSPDYIGSRGEYITGKILAKYLGWEFVDANELIFFNGDGTLDKEKSISSSREKLKNFEHAVIPAFYGAMPNGEIKTFSRGDGDTTGAEILHLKFMVLILPLSRTQN